MSTVVHVNPENPVHFYSSFILATVAASVVLTGCGNGDDTAASRRSPSAVTEQPFNDADIEFAQNMIPHHEQAVQMAAMAAARATSPEVKELAANIQAAQGPEIETMTGWLESWGEDVPSGMGHGEMGMDDMAGLMSDQQMNQLEGAAGATFDEMFLTMMIEHHEGAIEMAREEQADGKYPDAIALSKKIESDQAAEIETMRGLLAP